MISQEYCPFCDLDRIVGVLDFGSVVAFPPLNPVVPGHTLIVPKQHVKDFSEHPEVTAEVMRIAAIAAKLNGGDMNLITSKGGTATQSVYHLHVHLVPRTEGDGLKLPWTGQKKAKK